MCMSDRSGAWDGCAHARIRNEISDWTVGDGQPRGRFHCRYFVHAETPPKANDRRGFAPLENTIRSAQGEAGQGEAGQVEARAGRGEVIGNGNKRWCRYLCSLSMLMRDSHNGDQFEGCKCPMLRFLVPVFRFYHLFC